MITVEELEHKYGIPHVVMCLAFTRMSEVDEATIRRPLYKAIGEMLKEYEDRIETLEMLRKAKAQMEQEGI